MKLTVLLITLTICMVQIYAQCNEWQDPASSSDIKVGLTNYGSNGNNVYFMLRVTNLKNDTNIPNTNLQLKNVIVSIATLDGFINDLTRNYGNIAGLAYNQIQYNATQSDLGKRFYVYVKYNLGGQSKTIMKTFTLSNAMAARDEEEEVVAEDVTEDTNSLETRVQDLKIKWNTVQWTGQQDADTSISVIVQNIGTATLKSVTYQCENGNGSLLFFPVVGGNVISSISPSAYGYGALKFNGPYLGVWSLNCSLSYKVGTASTVYWLIAPDNTYEVFPNKKRSVGLLEDSSANAKVYVTLAGASAFVAVMAVVAAVVVVRRRSAIQSSV